MLSPAQRQRARDLVRRTWLRILARAFGEKALTPEEIAEVGELAPSIRAADRAYGVGVKAISNTAPPPLTAEEELRRDAARTRVGELIRGIATQHADRVAEVFDLEALREETAAAVEERQTPKQLAANLRRASEDVSRDWDRVATTELQVAANEGRATTIARAHGEGEPLVYKQAAPDACSHCLRLHNGPDGKPRVYPLSVLRAHGDNVGRKKRDWRAVVGPTHPHCTCPLLYLAPGWGFDENGDAVPGGEGGVVYETREDLERALQLEDEIQKAARVGGRVELCGFTIDVEANAGDVRKWRAPGGREGQTVLRFAYGEIPGTLGVDGDPVDVYLGPDPFAPFAFVVDQKKHDGSFDEQKVFLGFRSPNDVEAAYKLHYPAELYGGLMQLSVEELRTKLGDEGMIKSDGVARSVARGVDDRGWYATSSGAHAAHDTEIRPPQHKLRTHYAVEHERTRKRPRREIVPVVPIVPPGSARTHLRPVPEEGRRELDDEELEENASQLASRVESRRRARRVDPSVARIGSALPSQPNDLGSG